MTVIVASSEVVISAESSSSPPSTVGRPTSDADMAWLIADAADIVLAGHERTMTFVELGCGEYCLAVHRIINAIVSSRTTLPAWVFERLDAWLDAYVGSPEEPQLRSALARRRAQQLPSTRLPAWQGQCGDVRGPARFRVPL